MRILPYKNYKLFIFNASSMLLSVIQTAILTKILTKSEYGKYGFIITLSQIALVLIGWGYNAWCIKKLMAMIEVTRVKKYRNIIGVKLLYHVLPTLFIVIPILSSKPLHTSIFFAYIIYCIGVAISVEGFLVATGMQLSAIKIQILNKILVIIIICFTSYFFNCNSELIFLISSIVFLFLNILQVKKISINSYKFPAIKLSLFFIKKTAKFFNTSFASYMHSGLPLLICGIYMSGVDYAMIFSAVTVVKMFQQLYQPFINSISLDLHSSKHNINLIRRIIAREIKNIAVYVLIVIVAIILLGDIFIKIIFTEEYVGLINLICLVALSAIPGLVATLYTTQVNVIIGSVGLQNVFFWIVVLIEVLVLVIIGDAINPKIYGIYMVFFETVLALIFALTLDKTFFKKNA